MPRLAIAIKSSDGVQLIHACNRFILKELTFSGTEETYFFNIEHNLRPGRYLITLFLQINGKIEDWIENAISFSITESSPYEFNNISEIQGMIFPNYTIESKR